MGDSLEGLVVLQSNQLVIDKNPIGEGTSSKVYRVQYCGCVMVIKLMKFEKDEVGDVAVEKHKREQTISEFKFARDVSHPNIVQTHFLAYSSNSMKRLGIVMERFDEVLSDAVFNLKIPMTPQKAIQLGQNLGSALMHLHEMMRLDRDFKLENAGLVNITWTAKLIDFGHSVMADSHGNFPDDYAASPLYASYEMLCRHKLAPAWWPAVQAFRKIPITYKSDVYSFALSMTELFSGQQVSYPKVSSVEQLIRHLVVLRSPYQIPLKVRNDYPELVPIIQRSLSFNPSDRPTMAEWCDALKVFSESIGMRCATFQRLLEKHNIDGPVVPCGKVHDALTTAVNFNSSFSEADLVSFFSNLHRMFGEGANMYRMDQLHELFYRVGSAGRYGSWTTFLKDLHVVLTTMNFPAQLAKMRSEILLDRVPLNGYVVRYLKSDDSGLRLIIKTSSQKPKEINISYDNRGYFVAEGVSERYVKLSSCLEAVIQTYSLNRTLVEYKLSDYPDRS